MKQFCVNYYLDSKMEMYFNMKLPYDSPDLIKIKISELLKFLLLNRFYKSNVPFTAEIDEVWHLWILQTKQYLQLMTKLPFNEFIHHSSNEYISNSSTELTYKPRAAEELRKLSNDTIQKQFSYFISYVLNFGFFNEDTINYYPVAVTIMEIKKMTLEEFNRYLISKSRLEFQL